MNLSKNTRIALRIVFAGLIAAATSLQAHGTSGISESDVVDAIIAGVIAMGLWTGVGAATPIEPSFGIKSKNN